MPKRKCFFEEPPKNRICSRISTGDTTSSKTGIPFRVHPHAMAATGGETSRPVGERSGLVKTRTQGRAIGTSAACSPTWLIIQSITASFTGCAALHADRGGPQNGPRRMLHVRTASASIALSTARAPLPSDPNAPLSPSNAPIRPNAPLSPSNAPIRPNAPRYHPLPPAKPNQLRGINNLHAHTSHPSHPL